MTVLHIRIPGPPVGDQRPRVVQRRDGKGTMTYKPERSSAWTSDALALLAAHRPPEPLDEPLVLEVVAVMPRPQRLCRKSDPKARVWCLGKPDGDNVLKLVQDAIVKAGIIVDDTRIVVASVRKVHAAIEPLEQPHVEINLRRADAQE